MQQHRIILFFTPYILTGQHFYAPVKLFIKHTNTGCARAWKRLCIGVFSSTKASDNILQALNVKVDIMHIILMFRLETAEQIYNRIQIRLSFILTDSLIQGRGLSQGRTQPTEGLTQREKQPLESPINRKHASFQRSQISQRELAKTTKKDLQLESKPQPSCCVAADGFAFQICKVRSN